MTIFDLYPQFKSKKQFDGDLSEAEKIFVRQKSAIKEIAKTQGFKEIRDFHERERKAAMTRLATTREHDAQAQAMYALSDRFLTFLDNLAS